MIREFKRRHAAPHQPPPRRSSSETGRLQPLAKDAAVVMEGGGAFGSEPTLQRICRALAMGLGWRRCENMPKNLMEASGTSTILYYTVLYYCIIPYFTILQTGMLFFRPPMLFSTPSIFSTPNDTFSTPQCYLFDPQCYFFDPRDYFRASGFPTHPPLLEFQGFPPTHSF